MSDKYEFPDEVEDKAAPKEKDDDDFEIEVIDDTPAKDRGRKPLDREVADPSDDELEEYSDKVKGRIKELTHARHDERRAKETVLRERQELERLAQQLIEENNTLKRSVNNGQQAFAETAKQGAEDGLKIAKRMYKEAYEAGDSDALVAAQDLMTDAKLRFNAAQNFKPKPLQEDKYEVQQQQPVVSPTIDDKTLRWQAKNQWFGSTGNEEMTSFALGAHQKLVNNGVDPRSDEYFEKIDSRMRSTFHEFFGGNEDKPKSGDNSKRPTNVVASASRSTGTKKVQLTTTQVALAKKFGLTPQQYALEMAKMEKSNG
jgi:hypothetical protein